MAEVSRLEAQAARQLVLLRQLALPDARTSQSSEQDIVKGHKSTIIEATLLRRVFSLTYNKLLVRKVNTGVSEPYTVRHEALVGLLALNLLAAQIANFAPIYDYREKAIYSLPGGLEASGEAVFYQYIEGPTLAEFFQTCSFADLKSILLQLLLALLLANQTFGFVHCDLHGHNVLIQTPARVEPLQLEGHVLTQCRYRPVVIDYGRAIVRVQGQLFFMRSAHNPATHWRADVRSLVNIGKYYDLDRLQGFLQKNKASPPTEELRRERQRLKSLLPRAREAAVQEKCQLLRQLATLARDDPDGPFYERAAPTFEEFVRAVIPLLRE